jgi:hypothetical protein
MKEGFYSISFSGAYGDGFGMLVLDNGLAVGADAAGGTYDGTYAKNLLVGFVDIMITVTPPAGARAVQTGAPLATSIAFQVKATVPRGLGSSSPPIRVETPFGMVDVVFRKIRDFPN